MNEIMTLPCAGFDHNGDETVTRDAAAFIVEKLQMQLAEERKPENIVFQSLILAAEIVPGNERLEILLKAATALFGAKMASKAIERLKNDQ